MHHFVESITNTRGDALIGYYGKVVDPDTGSVVSIYADANATPIVSVSGLADAAQVNSDGNLDFYVNVGTYHLDLYATDGSTLVKRIENLPMNIDEDTAALAVEAQEAAEEAAAAAALSEVNASAAALAAVAGYNAIVAALAEGGSVEVADLIASGLPLQPSWFGAVGDGTADDSDALNSALAAGDTRLTAGVTYGVASPVMIPSNRTLWLNGATIKALSGFTNTTVSGNTINAPLAAHTTTGVTVFGPGTIDSNKVGAGGGDAARKNGIMMVRSRNFCVRQVTAKNATGYLFYTTGSSAIRSTGKFELCHAENGQYHYEFMGSEDITVDRCTSGDGDGDIACSAFIHPVFGDVGSTRIRVLNFYGYGAGSGVSILGNGSLANNDISFTDSHIEVTGSGNALLQVGSAGAARIKGSNSSFISADGYGGLCDLITEGAFYGCKFQGQNIAFEFGPGTKIDFTASRFIARPNTGAGGYGLSAAGGSGDTTSRVRLTDCEIDIASDTEEWPTSGSGIFVDRRTRLMLSLTSDVEHGQVTITGATNYQPKAHLQGKDLLFTWESNDQTVEFLAAFVSPMPLGSEFNIINATDNSGGRTLEIFGTGVTIESPGGLLAVAARGTVKAVKTAATEITLSGNLA